MSEKLYFKYWGKAGRKEGEQHLYHLLVFHSLDVAAVGNALLTKFPKLRKQLADLSGMSEEQFVRWILFLLALHDLGKFTDSFQNLRPDLLNSLQQRKSDASYGTRHDTLGYHFWHLHLLPLFVELGMVTEKTSRMRYTPDDLELFNAWMRAVTGHHGEPPRDERITLADYISEPDDVEAAQTFVTELIPLMISPFLI